MSCSCPQPDLRKMAFQCFAKADSDECVVCWNLTCRAHMHVPKGTAKRAQPTIPWQPPKGKDDG